MSLFSFADIISSKAKFVNVFEIQLEQFINKNTYYYILKQNKQNFTDITVSFVWNNDYINLIKRFIDICNYNINKCNSFIGQINNRYRENIIEKNKIKYYMKSLKRLLFMFKDFSSCKNMLIDNIKKNLQNNNLMTDENHNFINTLYLF